jgi:predicted ATPase
MIKRLRIKNFKSWKDTGNLEIAPLTGFFGANSSGKTSILQILLMLKQTVESTDRALVMNTGGPRSLVDLGTYFDLIHGHSTDALLEIDLSWKLPESLSINDPEKESKKLFDISELAFNTKLFQDKGPHVDSFHYSFDNLKFGMKRRKSKKKKEEYDLISDKFKAKREIGRVWPLPPPVKCYGFPDEVTGYYQNTGFLSELVLAFEDLFSRIAYLGPLRDYPQRTYMWEGRRPDDVGRKGELAVPALLASREKGKCFSPGYKKRRQTIEERVAYWLKEMGMIHSYDLKEIAENRKDYELKVKKTSKSPEVHLTDVGFGVSQILPVLVLCYYIPEGSVIILEQPEIHLHPSVQAWLADVFIEVVNRRNVQIIVESHSEHFLRRIQRRIADKSIPVDQTALFFCEMTNSASRIERLDVDIFGGIRNWPKDFFGDDIGDLVAMAEAEMNSTTAEIDTSK